MTASLFLHRPDLDPLCPRILSFLDLESLNAAWYVIAENNFPSRDFSYVDNVQAFYIEHVKMLEVFNQQQAVVLQVETKRFRLFSLELSADVEKTRILEKKLEKITYYLNHTLFTCGGKQFHAVALLTDPRCPVAHLSRILYLGANPDRIYDRNERINTPLHQAALHRNEAAIKELLSYRANPTATNRYGETYLDIFHNPNRPLPPLPSPVTAPAKTPSQTLSSQFCTIS